MWAFTFVIMGSTFALIIPLLVVKLIGGIVALVSCYYVYYGYKYHDIMPLMPAMRSETDSISHVTRTRRSLVFSPGSHAAIT